MAKCMRKGTDMSTEPTPSPMLQFDPTVFARLPLGNPGRANVSAFAPMPLRPDIAEVIAQVRSEVKSH